jgi:ACS family hexuronate transporter-like MFS transporter
MAGPGVALEQDRRRWWILALLFLVTVINFVDRQSLSIVAPVIRGDLHLSNQQYGIIVSAFQFGMLAGEFPMGWLMDRKGVRVGLSFAVLWWSAANALHTFGGSLLQFSVLRFWLGTGECGNYSGGNKVVSQCFPVRERAFAVGVFNGGSMVGSIIAPPLLVWLMLAHGWRSAFLLPSLLGFFWVALWLRFYRVSQPARAGHAAPGNRELLRMRRTWAIMLCRMLVGPVVQFYIFWLPEYLYRERGLSLKSIGMFAWLPFLFGDIGSMLGGWIAGRLIAHGVSVAAARAITMSAGAALCLFSLSVAWAASAPAALAWVCCVLFGHTFLSANMFAVVSDMFPPNAVGRVTALTGIAGGVSGFLFPLLTGFLVDHASYTPVFALAAIMPSLGCAVLFALQRNPGIVKS